jgi:uncharacterized protein YfaT (DUF1175 family)
LPAIERLSEACGPLVLSVGQLKPKQAVLDRIVDLYQLEQNSSQLRSRPAMNKASSDCAGVLRHAAAPSQQPQIAARSRRYVYTQGGSYDLRPCFPVRQ